MCESADAHVEAAVEALAPLKDKRARKRLLRSCSSILTISEDQVVQLISWRSDFGISDLKSHAPASAGVRPLRAPHPLPRGPRAGRAGPGPTRAGAPEGAQNGDVVPVRLNRNTRSKDAVYELHLGSACESFI